jgi:hypothetical protein
MAELSELIAKLEALVEPDRALDEALLILEVPRMADILPHWTAEQRENLVPRYTASLDATVALIERALPGWMVSIMIGLGTTVAHVRDKSIICEDKIEGSGYHNTPAVALLIAALKAIALLRAKETG